MTGRQQDSHLTTNHIISIHLIMSWPSIIFSSGGFLDCLLHYLRLGQSPILLLIWTCRWLSEKQKGGHTCSFELINAMIFTVRSHYQSSFICVIVRALLQAVWKGIINWSSLWSRNSQGQWGKSLFFCSRPMHPSASSGLLRLRHHPRLRHHRHHRRRISRIYHLPQKGILCRELVSQCHFQLNFDVPLHHRRMENENGNPISLGKLVLQFYTLLYNALLKSFRECEKKVL